MSSLQGALADPNLQARVSGLMRGNKVSNEISSDLGIGFVY